MRKLLALAVVCGAVLACDTRSGSSITVPFTAEMGTYTLKNVSGAPLPYRLGQSSPNTRQELYADTLFVTSGANIREVYWLRTITTTSTATPVTTDTASASTTVSGKYTIVGDSITVPASFGYRFGRYSNGTISFTDPQGFVYLFTKP